MRASRTPPDGYVPAGSVLLEGNRRLLLWMNLASLPILVVAGGGFAWFAWSVRPGLTGELLSWLVGSSATALSLAAALSGLLLVPLLVIVLHEAVHGLAFWCCTRTRPEFGFRGWYAYAAAPGWYLSRRQYLAVGLAPLVGISVTALALAAVLPVPLLVVVLYSATANAASATGDLYLCARIVALPAAAVVEDRRDGIGFLLPAAAPRVPAPRGPVDEDLCLPHLSPPDRTA